MNQEMAFRINAINPGDPVRSGVGRRRRRARASEQALGRRCTSHKEAAHDICARSPGIEMADDVKCRVPAAP